MTNMRKWHAAWLAASVVLLSGCGGANLTETLLTGNAVGVGTGAVRSWGVIDPNERPTQLNFSFSNGTTTGLPTEAQLFSLVVPRDLRSGFTHAILRWMPNGREGDNGMKVPCFALHLYTIPESQRKLIDTEDPTKMYAPPPPGFVPGGHVQDLMSGVKEVGSYWDPIVEELRAVQGPTTVTTAFGTYDNLPAFTAFFFSREFFDTRTQVTLELPEPELVNRAGYYPRTATIFVGEGLEDVVVTFQDFVYREETAMGLRH